MKTFLLYAALLVPAYTLGFYVNPWFFFLPGLLGLNLLQAAFTGVDPLIYLSGGKKSTSRPAPPPAG